MSRLIDADKLIEDVLNSMPTGSARGVFRAFVDEQPTAFDVDKVVKQLEEKSQLARPVGWVYPYEIILTKDVMKIVKRGGINE